MITASGDKQQLNKPLKWLSGNFVHNMPTDRARRVNEETIRCGNSRNDKKWIYWHLNLFEAA